MPVHAIGDAAGPKEIGGGGSQASIQQAHDFELPCDGLQGQAHDDA